MELYAPSYYKKFKCIAEKCDHSCCIGWEIDVDGDALEKYNALDGGYGSVIIDSIEDGETPHFRLCEQDRCPHLNENGLCNIIIHYGESYLCDICREHPRFYNYTSVKEVGVGMSCTAAAELILSSPDYAKTELIGHTEGEIDCIDFDGRAERNKVYQTLADENLDYEKRLSAVYEGYGIAFGEDEKWLDILDSLEYLDESHRKTFLSYSSKRRPKGYNEYLERFLAYFIYRHCTEASDREDFCVRLSFCLFCERLFASLIVAEAPKAIKEIAVLARTVSEEIEYSSDNTSYLFELADALIFSKGQD